MPQTRAKDSEILVTLVMEESLRDYGFRDSNCETFDTILTCELQHWGPGGERKEAREWKDLIERCWEQDPDSRPSFEEICASLKKKMHMLFYDADLDEIIEFRAKFFT